MMISKRPQIGIPEIAIINVLQPTVETPFIHGESVKTGSLGTSDAAQQKTLDKSEVVPSDLAYIYHPLREFGDGNRMSEASFL